MQASRMSSAAARRGARFPRRARPTAVDISPNPRHSRLSRRDSTLDSGHPVKTDPAPPYSRIGPVHLGGPAAAAKPRPTIAQNTRLPNNRDRLV